jgi:tyrocidine synthetase-3
LKKLPPWTPRKNFSLGEIFPAQKAYYKSYYQTGDLARWLPDGNIEFLGRIDHQVKIRGFRVEPGEIENRLRQLPTVNEAVVIDREYANGEVYLCAYLETRGEIVPRELRYQLSRILPDYMIPACFVPMEKIPLNPSGKVNRQALPSPAAGESGKNLLPPRDHLQKKLAELWSEVLEVEKQRIGLDTNFFELGGHSLKATILTLKIQKTFGVKVSLADIFRSRSLRALAEHLGKLAFTGFTPLAPREEKDYYPLSPAQRRLYFLHQVIADSTAYNLGHIFILEGNPEKNHLEQIFAQLIKRHESLRTWFPRPGGQPVQRIHRQLVFNLCHYTTPREDPGPIIEDFIKPFDLNRAPLLRVCLARLSNHGYLFMFDMHHIISDGISMQVLAREFMDLYSQRRLSPLEIQYKDYSQWQAQLLQTGKIKTMETFWLKTFSPPGPPLNLPLDYQRPLEPDISGDQVAFHLSREETDALKQLAAANQTTLFMVLLSLYNILLARVCGQETVTVGTAVAGRPHHDLQNIIGIFVNTVALRNNPANHKSFRHFLQELKENTMKAFENQDYQFEILVDKVEQNQNPQYNNREALRNPLFDVAFGFQDIHMPPLQMPGLTLKPYNPKNRISKFDLTLYGTDAGQQLHFILEYRTRLFKQATIRRLAGYTREIAAAVTENPGILLKDITLTHDFVDLELKVPQLEDDDFGF